MASPDNLPASSVEREGLVDPDEPPPYWHQTLELVIICVFNSLTLLTIIARTWIRRINFNRFKRQDIWIVLAGVSLIFPHWVCQIGTNRYGSGLHVVNIPKEWDEPFWKFSWGWMGYYVVASLIKVSVCASLLEILPPIFRGLRRVVYCLCAIIISLGVAESLVWLFQCLPVGSNFNFYIEQTSCINVDYPRYAWVGISVAIDLAIVYVPFAILKHTMLRRHERIVLIVVFGANLLGTVACAIGAYGIWSNRQDLASSDLSYTETTFIIITDVEIFLYTIGASATMTSRYFVARAERILLQPDSTLRTRSRPSPPPSSNSDINDPGPSTYTPSSCAIGPTSRPVPYPQHYPALPHGARFGARPGEVELASLDGSCDWAERDIEREFAVDWEKEGGAAATGRVPLWDLGGLVVKAPREEAHEAVVSKGEDVAGKEAAAGKEVAAGKECGAVSCEAQVE